MKPNRLVGEAYMAAIRPFRHHLIYPPMMRDVERQWRARAGERTPFPAQDTPSLEGST